VPSSKDERLIQLKGRGGGAGGGGGGRRAWRRREGDINQSETSLETIYCQWWKGGQHESF